MRARRPMLPSPATVLASVALLVTLSGTAVAAMEALPKRSVGTAQLKQGAVTSPKIKDGAVTSADVRNGSLLRADFRPGQVPPGPTGPQGPPGLSGWQLVQVETVTNSASPKNSTAGCPPEKKVIGGGTEISGAGRSRVTVTESHPAGESGWEAEGFEAVSTGAPWKLVVHAICASVQ